MASLDGPDLANTETEPDPGVERPALGSGPAGQPRRRVPTRASQRPPEPAPDTDWGLLLGVPGPSRDAALARLHGLLLRAARHQVSSMLARMPDIGPARREELANQAADEAMVAVLSKLHTFEGRSRFTTWAYKFAILQAAAEVRRNLWRHRDVPLDSLPDPAARGGSPEELAEAGDFSRAVARAIDEDLTAHQRRVVVALLVDGVPIDVLADRLGTSRNALYKTVHDARTRLRESLSRGGYLAPTPQKGTTP